MKHRTIKLAVASCGIAFLASCAQPTAVTQSGKVDVTTPSAAEQRSAKLATARGGPGEGKRDPKLETVAVFDGKAMPTGVTVSKEGRIFLCYPRWGDKVIHTVVELREGQLIPFPDSEVTQFDPNVPDSRDPHTHLVSVQSVFVDGRNVMWIVDPGSINLAPVIEGAPKVWAYDLATGKRIKEITFPNDVVLKRTYLNDIRIDYTHGDQGTAYLTDSGAGGIVVIDLASGKSWRHLDGHPSVMPTPALKQMSEGEPLLQRKPTGEVSAPSFHSDGIALRPNGKTLYYNAIASHDVWSVPTDLLANQSADEQAIAKAVQRVATKPSGNDGLICDQQGLIYSTDFEDNAIRRTDPTTGQVQVLVQDERLLWPDTFAIHDGYLYVTSNQLARQPNYHFGKDQRVPPYALFRVSITGGRTAMLQK